VGDTLLEIWSAGERNLMSGRQNQNESRVTGFIPMEKITVQLTRKAQGNEEAYALGCLAFGRKTTLEKMLPHMGA
jgi:hypothetical protein